MRKTTPNLEWCRSCKYCKEKQNCTVECTLVLDEFKKTGKFVSGDIVAFLGNKGCLIVYDEFAIPITCPFLLEHILSNKQNNVDEAASND